jgi:hypothetical protein
MNYTELGEILSQNDHFNSLTKLHKKRLVRMVLGILNGDYKHKKVSPTDGISVSIHSKKLKKWFRKEYDIGNYLKVIEPYLDCVDESYCFGFGSKGYTKKYILKDWIYDKCFDYWNTNTKPVEISIIGKDIKPITTIPDNGISDVDSNGNPRSNKIQINPCVELNLNTINETIDELIKTKSRMRIRKDIKKNNLTHLLKWKHNLNNTLCPNKVLQLYQEGWDGRLYQQSNLSIPHFISTPNRIRKVLFNGMDLYDYDMSNSHLTIFYGLCERYGMNCSYIGEYNEKKNYYRNKWSDDFNTEIKKLKKYILSWLYGNDMNPVRGNPYYDVLNYHRMNDIKNDRMLNGIYKEILEGRKLIIRNQPTNNGKYVNVLNKEIPKKNKVGKTLSFFQFGYETKVLEIVNELIGDKMKVLIYDGWIGQKCDVSILETTIKQRLGIDIRFSEKKINKTPISTLS